MYVKLRIVLLALLLAGTFGDTDFFPGEDGTILAERRRGSRRRFREREPRKQAMDFDDDLSRLLKEFGGVHVSRLLKRLGSLRDMGVKQIEGLSLSEVTHLAEAFSSVSGQSINFNDVSRILTEFERHGLTKMKTKDGKEIMSEINEMMKNSRVMKENSLSILKESSVGDVLITDLNMEQEKNIQRLNTLLNQDSNTFVELVKEILQEEEKIKETEQKNAPVMQNKPKEAIVDGGQTNQALNDADISQLLSLLAEVERIEANLDNEGKKTLNNEVKSRINGGDIIQEGIGTVLSLGLGSALTILGLGSLQAANILTRLGDRRENTRDTEVQNIPPRINTLPELNMQDRARNDREKRLRNSLNRRNTRIRGNTGFSTNVEDSIKQNPTVTIQNDSIDHLSGREIKHNVERRRNNSPASTRDIGITRNLTITGRIKTLVHGTPVKMPDREESERQKTNSGNRNVEEKVLVQRNDFNDRNMDISSSVNFERNKEPINVKTNGTGTQNHDNIKELRSQSSGKPEIPINPIESATVGDSFNTHFEVREGSRIKNISQENFGSTFNSADNSQTNHNVQNINKPIFVQQNNDQRTSFRNQNEENSRGLFNSADNSQTSHNVQNINEPVSVQQNRDQITSFRKHNEENSGGAFNSADNSQTSHNVQNINGPVSVHQNNNQRTSFRSQNEENPSTVIINNQGQGNRNSNGRENISLQQSSRHSFMRQNRGQIIISTDRRTYNNFRNLGIPVETIFRAAVGGESPTFLFGEFPSRLPVVERGVVSHVGSFRRA